VGGHDHDHHHPHPAGEQAAGGPVVLDIGDDRGALIVYLAPAWIGTELHIRAAGEHDTTHTGVWERPLGRRRPVAAVFPSLALGRYTIVADDGSDWCGVEVASGTVTEATLVA
jgi:hypothetical protein